MRFLRMRPGHGEQLIAEGDIDVPEQERDLVAEFRRQLDQGMWAAVPKTARGGRREAEMVRAFEEVPRDAGRVIFFPRAAGGSQDWPPGTAAANPHGSCVAAALRVGTRSNSDGSHAAVMHPADAPTPSPTAGRHD